ncbi:hypothetical protein GC197_04435 [bacterium]|nr:hypothetical protein [bacterium]
MNIFLWIVQGLLAVHTVMGAVWKFSHSAEQTMPSLGAIPQGMWLTMSGLEMLCAIALIIPAFSRSLTYLPIVAAGMIAAEMLLFTGLHFYSGSAAMGPVVYWLIVFAICGLIIYGRLNLRAEGLQAIGA